MREMDTETRRRREGIFTTRELDMILGEELRRAARDLEAANQPLSNGLRVQVKGMMDDAEKLERRSQPPPRPDAALMGELRARKQSGRLLTSREDGLLESGDLRDQVAAVLSEEKTISPGMRLILRDLIERAERLELKNA